MRFTPLHRRALDLAQGLSLTPSHLERVAREVEDADLARWAFGQHELRRRARTKFADPDRLFLDREALEQATHERVALWHAAQFPVGVPVVDLTTGLGSDLIALAIRGPVLGIEQNPERAAMAQANLIASDRVGEVLVADAMDWLTTEPGQSAQYLWADPSRRVDGQRTLHLDRFSPHPRALAEAFRGRVLAGQKLSPLLEDADLERLGERLDFVSFAGECREVVAWRGEAVEPGRWAVRAEDGERLPAGPPPPGAEGAGAMVFEADPAAIRAHALGALAERLGLQGLGQSPGYLTGPAPVESPWLTAFRVLEDLPFDRKRVRAALRALRRRPEAVKLRGVRVDVVRAQHDVDPGPSAEGPPVVLILVPLASGVRCLITER